MTITQSAKGPFYGWWLLAVCWLIVFLNQGFPNYGATVMNGFMAKAMHANRESMGGLFSIYLMVGGAPGLIAGGLVARTGSRVLLALGGLSLLIGACLMAFWVTSIEQAIIAFGIFVGFSILAGGFLGTQYALAHWFHRRRALAMSILYTASGFGGFIAPPLLNKIIERSGGDWRTGWWVLIACGLTTMVLALFFVRDKPEVMGQTPDGDDPSTLPARTAEDDHVFRTQEEWTLGEALRTPVLWVLVGCFTAATIGFHVFLAHGVLHLRDQGFSPAQAASAVSIVSIGSLIAKTIVGLLGDRFDPRYLWVMFLGIFGVGMVIFANVTTPAELTTFTLCLGGGFGGILVCMVTVMPNYFGVKIFPILTGLTLTIQGSLVALMPFITGYVFDKLGSYEASFFAIAGLCWLMGALLLLQKRPRRKAVTAG